MGAPKVHQVQGMELLLKEGGAAANWNTNRTCLFVLVVQCPDPSDEYMFKTFIWLQTTI
jgi:hypothetical protein